MPVKPKRADGRYQVSVYLGRDKTTGKRKQKVFYGKSQREAKQKRDKWLAEHEGNLPKDGKDYTLEQWTKVWLETYASSTYNIKRSATFAVKSLLTSLGSSRKMADISAADIAKFAQQFGAYKMDYVRHIRGFTNSIFDTAVENGIIARSPCGKIRWTGETDGSHRALEPWERDLIRETWQKHPAGVFAMLMLYTGMRPGEALGLSWENVTDKAIRIRDTMRYNGNEPFLVKGDTKTGEKGIREVPMPAPLKAMLETIPHTSSLVCDVTVGTKPTRSAVNEKWKSYTRMLSIAHGSSVNIRQYDLRHTYCTMLYDAGVDVKTAQYLMGHTNPVMTMRIYTHLSEQRKEKSFDALLEYLND